MPETTDPRDAEGDVLPGAWMSSSTGARIGYEAECAPGIARLTFVWPNGREVSVQLSRSARNTLRRLLGPEEVVWVEDRGRGNG